MITKEFKTEINFSIPLKKSSITFEYGKKYDLLNDSIYLGYAIIQDNDRDDGYETIKFFLNEELESFNYKPMIDTMTTALHFIDVDKIERA